MSNQGTNGIAVSSFTLQLSEDERELLGINAQANGTSVANYVRSFIPELEPKIMGRPRKDNSPKSKRSIQKKKQKKRRRLVLN